MTLVITTDQIDTQLDALIGRTGLTLEGWVEESSAPSHLALREEGGELILLQFTDFIYSGAELPPTEKRVQAPHWLEQGTPAFAAWNSPFGEMFVRDLGCDSRSSERQFVVEETPWALQFDSDDGAQTLYDQSVGSVHVGGQAYTVFVSGAFSSVETTMSDSVSAATFLIARTN